MGKSGHQEKIIEDHVEASRAQKQLLGSICIKEHLTTRLSIEIAAHDIKNPLDYRPIKGKARLSNGPEDKSNLEVDCFVASGHWNKLGQLNGTINIFDHLTALLPTQLHKIGLVTFQNGIQNKADDLEKMADSIIANLLPDKPLCIGLYNPTNGVGIGIIEDLKRLMDPWSLNAYAMLFTRQLFFTLADLIPGVSSHQRWVHLAHSEGGLMASRVLTSPLYPLSFSHQSFFKNRLTTLTYGAVDPIPDSAVFKAINTYSKADIMIRWYGKSLLDKIPEPDDTESEANDEVPPISTNGDRNKAFKEAYKKAYCITKYPYECTKNNRTITVVESKVPYPPAVSGDHAFQGDTYKTALKKNIGYAYGRNEQE